MQDAHILVLKGLLMYFHFQMILALLVQYLEVSPPQTLWLKFVGTHIVVILSNIWYVRTLSFSKKSSILVCDKCVLFEINTTFYLQVMVKMTLFSSLLGSVQESAYTMLHLANAQFWRMFFLGTYPLPRLKIYSFCQLA